MCSVPESGMRFCSACACPSSLLVAEGAVLLLLGLLSESGAGVLLSAAAALGCLLVAFLPVQGRPLVEWVRPLLNYLYGRVTGQGLFLGGPWAMHAPTDGPHDPSSAGRGGQRSGPRREREERRGRGGPSGVAMHGRAPGDRARLPARGPVDPAATRVRLGFAACPARPGGLQAGRDPVGRAHHPRLGSRVGGLVAEQGRPRSRRVLRSYEALIAQAGPAATRHETFVVVSIDARRCKRAIRRAGGGPDGIAQVLMSELAWVEAGLRRGDVEVVGWLGPEDLARLIRTQYDPAATQGIDNRPGRRRRRDSGCRGRAHGRASRLHPLPHRQRLPRRLLDRVLAAHAGRGGLALPAARARRRTTDDLGDRGTRCPVPVLP